LVEVPLSLLLIVVDWKFAFGNICGYSFHRWCDNDLDLMGANSAEGRQVNEIPLLGHFMFGISSTYGSIFRKYHRSFITHFPFISTLIRLIFFLTPPFILGDYWGINFIGNGWHMFWVGFWIGLSQADGIHWVLDKFYNPTGE
jgi:hypothetical protein